jgi:hypothetical protein
MVLTSWTGQYSFAIVQVAATGGLLLVAMGLILEARARRVANLIQLTQQHRDLWERMYTKPALARILNAQIDLSQAKVTSEEEMFVVFIILHLSSFYYAMRAGFFQKPHGLRKDIERFFSLPIPRHVWLKVRDLQDRPFVRFVEKALQTF